MNILLYALRVFLSYLLGCSSMALYVSKLKGVYMRSGGSKNLGAANAMVLMGWRYGVLVALHDMGKAALAVALARHFAGELPGITAAAGVACVLGHIFPFYLRFKGGKGFASYLGMTLALNWKFALIVLLMVALVTLISDYIVPVSYTHLFFTVGKDIFKSPCTSFKFPLCLRKDISSVYCLSLIHI